MNWSQQLRLCLIALGVTALVTFVAVLLRGFLTLSNFTMIYLLLVLLIAVRLGTLPALLIAFTSFVGINFFLLHPFYSLSVADPRELLDLSVFLIVAAISGRLGARLRQNATDAQHRAEEQAILYQLTRSFNQLTTEEGVHKVLKTMMETDLGARSARLVSYLDVIMPSGRHAYALPLETRTRSYGTLHVLFEADRTPAQVELLNACVAQAAMALERIELAAKAAKSQQFEAADKLKTAILHAVSHDLRTPITIIKTSASNLRHLREQLTPQEEIEISEVIEHEADELDKLVGNLLDMSRLKAGTVALNRRPNPLEEIAGDVAARVWQLTRQERVRINFPDDMPLVPFDYGLMLQAVTNLVDNSLRYEPAESQIEIQGQIAEAWGVLKVINHGETIPDDEKGHIMEPFYHGKGGRSGLGLPIAMGIIEAHRGRLRVEDTPGGGASFVIELPLKEGLEA